MWVFGFCLFFSVLVLGAAQAFGGDWAGGQLLFLVMCRLLFAMASPVQEHRLQTQGLSSWQYTGLVAPQRVKFSQTRD